jgi:outer membrane protein TolC
MEVQQQNAANMLEVAHQDELKARTELASLLRLKQLPADLSLLTIPEMPSPVSYTSDEVAKLALSNSPAYQHQLAELTEARHQEYKARKERGINVGIDVNLGMQQVNKTFGSAFKNQQLYALGSVQFSIPLMDHGAAKKRHEKASAWADRQELASQEVERLLAEDAAVTLQKLQFSRDRLLSTQKTIKLAEEAYNETADNYANGLCDINTFTLAQSRWAAAYSNYLAALEEFWVSHYHLQTLINYE